MKVVDQWKKSLNLFTDTHYSFMVTSTRHWFWSDIQFNYLHLIILQNFWYNIHMKMFAKQVSSLR